MLKLIRYNDSITSAADIWFWVNEDDCLAGPIFETEEDAWAWHNARKNSTT